MPKPKRSDVIKPDEPGIYHCTSQCVRQLFLMGKDAETGEDKSHRRDFVISRVKHLAKYFGIIVCFRAFLDNHLHLILATLPQDVRKWSDEEVIARVVEIFPYKFQMLGVKDGEVTDELMAQFTSDLDLMKEMRSRLSSPSWFMRQLLHPLAVLANREDNVKGHFVSKPFEAIPIVDEQGLLSCGIYLDLNEIRAMIADRPESSMYSSSGDRIMARQLRQQGKHGAAAKWDGYLRPISVNGDEQRYPKAGKPGSLRATDVGMFELHLDDYLKLLDAAGRVLHPKKRGKIPDALPPVLERLDMDMETLIAFVENYERLFRGCVGSAKGMHEYSLKNRRRVGDIKEVARLEAEARSRRDDASATRDETAKKRTSQGKSRKNRSKGGNNGGDHSARGSGDRASRGRRKK